MNTVTIQESVIVLNHLQLINVLERTSGKVHVIFHMRDLNHTVVAENKEQAHEIVKKVKNALDKN